MGKVKGGLWKNTSLFDRVATAKQSHSALANKISGKHSSSRIKGSAQRAAFVTLGVEKSLASPEIIHYCKATPTPSVGCTERKELIPQLQSTGNPVTTDSLTLIPQLQPGTVIIPLSILTFPSIFGS